MAGADVRREALRAMREAGLGTVWVGHRWVWPSDVRESDDSARDVLAALHIDRAEPRAPGLLGELPHAVAGSHAVAHVTARHWARSVGLPYLFYRLADGGYWVGPAHGGAPAGAHLIGPPLPPRRYAEAYSDRFRAGLADAALGVANDYATIPGPEGSYAQSYALGYTAGQRARRHGGR